MPGFSRRWHNRAALFASLVILTSAAHRPPQAVTPDAWRADLAQLRDSILEAHPRPFAHVTPEELDDAVDDLDAAIPELDAHEIVLRMAQIVALLQDGHTRLGLPRSHPEIGFSYSDSADPTPADSSLLFDSLPVRFTALEQGLFVDWTAPGFEALLGNRVVSFAGLAAEDALEAAGRLVSAENEGARRLNAADRLGLSQVLTHIGVESRDCGMPVTLESTEGTTESRCLPILAADVTVPDVPQLPPYRLEDGGRPGIVVLELNEITSSAEAPLGRAVAEAVSRAEAAHARLVVDLRRNTGGNNAYARIVTLAVARSRKLNVYGRLFVLIGPRTFSAAQNLVNELERYTHALFVGEPSGSRPDHFGDARRVILANTGLTLRVSTIHWNSGTGGDVRDATMPHLPAPRTAATLVGAEDPALDVSADYTFEGLAQLIGGQLTRGRVFNAANLALLDATEATPSLSVDDYLALASRLGEQDLPLPAAYALQIGLFVYPGDQRLASAFEEARARL